MRMARLVLSASVALLGMGSAMASAQTKDPALDKLAADWSAAFAHADAKTLATLYTENAVRVTPEGGKVVGRSAIEKEFTTNFAGAFKGAAIKINVGAIETVGPDIAVNEGTYEVSGVTGPDGKAAPPIKGSYLNTIVKKGGAWKIASNAAILPPAPAK
jgi:uncharacterized protein (TIGR02246 family)